MLGAMEMDENHLGHGYDSMVVKVLSKIIAEMGFDVYMPIHEDNDPYVSLFTQLGFKSAGHVHWIVTKLNWT